MHVQHTWRACDHCYHNMVCIYSLLLFFDHLRLDRTFTYMHACIHTHKYLHMLTVTLPQPPAQCLFRLIIFHFIFFFLHSKSLLRAELFWLTPICACLCVCKRVVLSSFSFIQRPSSAIISPARKYLFVCVNTYACIYTYMCTLSSYFLFFS